MKTKEFEVNYTEMFTSVLKDKGTISQCFRTFHNYSVNNQFLAYWQLHCRGKEISPISSFSNWNKLNRKIKKGEKAIYLWMPIGGIKKEVEDKETGEKKEVVVGTRFKYLPRWFAYSQTEPMNGEAEKDMETYTIPSFDFNKMYKELEIKLIAFDKLNGNIQGYARPFRKELALNPLAEDLEMTIFHEVTHILLHGDEEKSEKNPALEELEAETVAYICGSVLGLPDEQLERSRGYVQRFFNGNEIPEKNAKNIMKAAQMILQIGLGK